MRGGRLVLNSIHAGMDWTLRYLHWAETEYSLFYNTVWFWVQCYSAIIYLLLGWRGMDGQIERKQQIS